MTNDHADITDRVVATAKRLESTDSPDEINPLEFKFTVSYDGRVREVTAVLTIGGPHIEVDCIGSVVRGSWGGDSHTTHVDSDAVDALGEIHARRFEENMIA